MKTLYVISGAAGMTGSETARRAVRSGEVIGFDNFFASCEKSIEDLLQQKGFTFFQYDINNQEHMRRLSGVVEDRKKSCDRLIYINCAAVVHTEHFYEVENTFTTNVLGMKTFLEQAIVQGADTYINCSTSEVYSMKSFEEGGVREDDYLVLATAEHSQRTSYAAGKLMTEFFMRDAVNKNKIRGCSIRFANVYSDFELYPKHIIPHILVSLREKGSVTLLDNSKVNKRTFLHNHDSCRAVLALCEMPKALDGSVYNVATEEEISITDLVETCAGMLGIDRPEIIFEGHREADPVRRILNTDKIRRMTNWKPKVYLAEGIKMCIDRMDSEERRYHA